MEADWGMVAIRLGLYLSLMLLVGLAAFPLYSLSKTERDDRTILDVNGLLSIMATTSIALSALAFLALVANMAGTTLTSPDLEVVRSILLETPIGSAWALRMAALLAAVAATLFLPTGTKRLLVATIAGGVALGTLVWTGHAGATDGPLSLLHKISDILHMLAAAIWIGSILAFLLLLSPSPSRWSDHRLSIAHRALEKFSRVGTICVSIVVATGLLNGQILVGIQNASRLTESTYGFLLLLKVAFFGAMLLLAAKNRWRLTPDLGRAIAQGASANAISALRISLFLEIGFAVTILILVAWLGMLEPTAG